MANRQDYSSGGPPVLVGASSVGTPTVKPGSPQQLKPFRIGTVERSDIVQVDALTVTTAEQLVEHSLPSTGYVYAVDLDYQAIAASNAATVAYAEDGPYSAASSVQFRDVDAYVIDSPGWELKQTGRYGGWEPNNQESSLDTTIWQKTTGSGGSGGSFRFHLNVPIALNRRTLTGLQGNQDRGQSYQVRSNLAASSQIYGTAPTTLPPCVITRHYESYTVPNPVDDLGNPQQVVPPTYGVIPYISRSVNANVPVGGQQTTHYLQRLNTTFRLLLLVLRSNGSRATAESNLPTNLAMRVGNQPIVNETAAFRRKLMWNRYGFDAPSGVFAYDFIHDFTNGAGAELGHDWFWTQQLAEAQFLITYPSGFGSTANSLTIMTADLTVPAGMNLYAA